jgi:hypothetical protein
MRSTGLKIGRKHASGYRVIGSTSRQDLGPTLAGLGAGDAKTARNILRRSLAAQGPNGILLKAGDSGVAVRLAQSGVLVCQEKALGTAAQPRWIPWRAGLAPDAAAEVKEALGILDVGTERRDLIAAVQESSLLAGELSILRAYDLTTGGRVPPNSKARTRSWSVYAAALRCTAEWEMLRSSGIKPSSREVAARALGSSKAWTPARRAAFESLVALPFDEAMNHTEAVVKFRGPIRWQVNGRVGDGLSSGLWVGLPASTVTDLEIVDCQATAILVIENEKTFEEVLRRSSISESVLCLYGGGFLGEAEISLLRQLDLPVYAWADLDPQGIQIVRNIAARIDRPVLPVLMAADLLESSPSRAATAVDVELALSMLGADSADELVDLASRISTARVKVEQESLHHLIDRLPDLLSETQR